MRAAAHSVNKGKVNDDQNPLRAGGIMNNHNEALKIRTALKAGGLTENHNEALKVRSEVKAGGLRRRMIKTTSKNDRLELLVVRAGLRAGARYTGRACK
jgi:hypothetical protein